MSGLVSYGMGSSDESDASDSEGGAVTTSLAKAKPQPGNTGEPDTLHQKKTSLFSSLPKPRSNDGEVVEGIKSSASAKISSTSMSLLGSASTHGNEIVQKKASLFSSLPPPKTNKFAVSTTSNEADLDSMPSSSSLAAPPTGTGTGMSASAGPVGFLNLPPPKKKQPVKISLPALPDPDSDEDEPAEKKPKTLKGAGLFSVLPKPRTASRKEANRLLIPHTLTKKPSPATSIPARAPAPLDPQRPKDGVSASTSRGHPAGANALVSGYNSDDDDDEEEEEEEDGKKASTKGQVNFFSMEEYEKEKQAQQTVDVSTGRQQPTPADGGQTSALQSGRVSQSDGAVGQTGAGPGSSEEIGPPAVPAVQDQPLVFNPTRVQSSGYPTGQSYQNQYGQPNPGHLGSSYPSATTDPVNPSRTHGTQDQMVAGGYQASSGTDYNQMTGTEGGASWQGGPSSQSFLQDEGFAKMVGKKNRGKEAIQIIDINADDQIGPTAGLQAMVKSMTEEKEYRGKLKKEQLPTSQQKRKHQITYLARQAKERELELKNQWADNRMTRKQTQAKYGF